MWLSEGGFDQGRIRIGADALLIHAIFLCSRNGWQLMLSLTLLSTLTMRCLCGMYTHLRAAAVSCSTM